MTAPRQRLPRNFFDDAAPFKIDGICCKLIPISRGLFTIVELADYKALRKFKWFAHSSRGMNRFYVVRNTSRKSEGASHTISMHRQILGLSRGDKRIADHRRSGETLDNRRSNLRITDDSGNSRNQAIGRANVSGYKGVSFHKLSGKFRATIMVNSRSIHLGLRSTAKSAHEDLYVPAALLYFGEFANDGNNRLA